MPKPDEAATLAATRAFVAPRDVVGAWQVGSTLLGIAGVAFAVSRLGPTWGWALAPLWGLLLVRLFVLQHDCGHHSLFRRARTNDRVGTLTSIVLGIPYEAWRTEHDWHHKHQGKLSCRGIDRVNSPMTVEEARGDPAAAAKRARFVNLFTVFVFGAHSLAVKRKRPKGFFPFRPGFRWAVRGRARIPRTVYLTGAAHAGLHLGLLIWLGPLTWVSAVFVAYFIGAGVGALLFWVQHNFETTVHADDARWSFVRTAVEGSSYLALPWPLTWFTASIGLHHVHHLNPRIPNYRLEDARRGIPALTAVRPLDGPGWSRCFSHVFWDGSRGRMVDLAGARAEPRSADQKPKTCT